jgi:MOSC domain-containing protein YiiM
MSGVVTAVSLSPEHGPLKRNQESVRLLEGRGVEGDAHLGENVTTRGLDLLGLPAGTRLLLGDEAVVEVTGLRDPCSQLDGIQQGLMKATLDRDADGSLVRKTGIMSIVVAGGVVRPGDTIRVEPPSEPHRSLEVV